MVYFIADLHLGHANIIKYCDRPFKDVNKMNETIIRNWNNTVGKDDKVFLLGDFAFGSAESIKRWGRSLNGNKTLILGNHDNYSQSLYYDAGFKDVIKYPILWNEKYILSHKPSFYEEKATRGRIYFNIYGHVHNDSEWKDVTPGGICVSAERIGYTPISFNEIVKRIKK